MALEIERKFLFTDLPPDVGPDAGTPIRQGYLAIADDAEVRLRDKGGRFFEAVKIGRGMVRDEFQVELDRSQFDALWPATKGRRIQKTRYRLKADGHRLDADVFDGALRGLNVVEVEFPDVRAAESYSPPDWFGREVTGDDRYANRCLAVSGVPT
jgi:CYTH domain-containing protein